MDLAGALDRDLKAGRVSAGVGDRTVTAEVADADRIGVLLHGLTVERAGRGLPEALAGVPPAVSQALRRPVRVVEADLGLGGGTARSEVEDRSYFELRTTGAATTLDHWRVAEGRRERIPWSLTREDLARLVRALES